MIADMMWIQEVFDVNTKSDIESDIINDAEVLANDKTAKARSRNVRYTHKMIIERIKKANKDKAKLVKVYNKNKSSEGVNMKNMEDYTDNWELITVKSGDGGDTAANEFSVLYAKRALGMQITADKDRYTLNVLRDNVYKIRIRHPNPAKWYSDPNRYSRDQLRPLMYYLGMSAAKGQLSVTAREHRWTLFVQHLKRGLLFAWNTVRNHVYIDQATHLQRSTPDVAWDPRPKVPDITGPESWATWIRVFRAWPLYPVLCILDAHILINMLVYKYALVAYKLQGKPQPKVDIRNSALGVDFANRSMVTPLGALALAITDKQQLKQDIQTWWGDNPEEPPVHNYLLKLF